MPLMLYSLVFKDSNDFTRNVDHVFNIFLEILKWFQFVFVLTIFVGWLKIDTSAQPEKIKDKLLL